MVMASGDGDGDGDGDAPRYEGTAGLHGEHEVVEGLCHVEDQLP